MIDKLIASVLCMNSIHGDLKDHIQIIDGNFFTSLDVKLDEGNINGIVDFKLFIPETRKDPNYEILFTKFLSEIDILAPRTFLVDVKVNNLEKKMLFQEKVRKEMLEYNKRIEGPLLEGSERYMFTSLENNNPFFNSGLDNQVARITNSSWAKKSENHFRISNKALTELNKVYLKVVNDGIILVDDCGWPPLPGPKQACEEFLEDKNIKDVVHFFKSSKRGII